MGIDDFALRRCHRCHDYATVVIDAYTGTRISHGLCDAAAKEVAAHSACWATVTGLRQGKLVELTLQRL
ncbi:hypothetical protein AB5J49_46390 [Streptomyces sp. R28]|uniref:Transposase n=1 Tax=Streptomyces sp. R28 TaxID=3238628 RepID=A0AB39QFR8_9ACTN